MTPEDPDFDFDCSYTFYKRRIKTDIALISGLVCEKSTQNGADLFFHLFPTGFLQSVRSLLFAHPNSLTGCKKVSRPWSYG